MDRRGHQLLAGAALALDQHRRVRRRDADDHALHRLHRSRDADQLANPQLLTQPAPQRVDLLPQEASLQDMAQEVAQLLEDQGLGEIVIRAQLQRLHRGGDGGVAGHHQHLDRRIVALEVPEKLHAVHLRQVDVHDGDLEELGLEQLDGASAGRHDDGLVSPAAENLGQSSRRVSSSSTTSTCRRFIANLRQRGRSVSVSGSPSRSTRVGPSRGDRGPGRGDGTRPPSRHPTLLTARDPVSRAETLPAPPSYARRPTRPPGPEGTGGAILSRVPDIEPELKDTRSATASAGIVRRAPAAPGGSDHGERRRRAPACRGGTDETLEARVSTIGRPSMATTRSPS